MKSNLASPLFVFFRRSRVVWMVVVVTACNSPEAPWCLMTAGEQTQLISSYPDALFTALEMEDHLDVEVELWDSSAVEIQWSGPENILAHRKELVAENELILGWDDACEWARDLSLHPRVLIRLPRLPAMTLRGQGRFELTAMDSTQSMNIDAWAFAGEIRCQVDLDTCSIRLHAGVALTEISGQVNTLQGYSSGLSRLDAQSCDAKQAFINQSGHPVLSFQATDYAFVQIESSGDVVGMVEPVHWELRQLGSGQLIWN